jgi:hypothetical protein
MKFEEVRFNKFVELVKDQFCYGGKKYALSGDNQRESTDILFDKHGKNWLIGTIDKYTFRFKNLARERDILKIATYMYIIWLKRGFFVMPNGVVTPIDTNLEVKGLFFDKFIKNVIENATIEDDGLEYNLDTVSALLGIWSSRNNFHDIYSNNIYKIFSICYLEWSNRFYDKAGKDTDTWNEKKD